MITLHKKIVVDEQGKPMEVIIPWDEYKELEEILGIDLDQEAIENLNQARKDRVNGKKDAYVDLDSI